MGTELRWIDANISYADMPSGRAGASEWESRGSCFTLPPFERELGDYLACEPSQCPCGFCVLPQPHFFGAGVCVGAGAPCEPSQWP
jgi:hypothetical protein